MASDGVVRRVDEPSRPAGRDSPVPVDFRLQMDIHDKGQGAERQGARGSTQGNHASGAFPARAVQGPLGSPNRGLVAIRCKEAARGGHNRRAVLLPRPAPCLYRTPLPSLHDVYQVEKALGHANLAVTEAISALNRHELTPEVPPPFHAASLSAILDLARSIVSVHTPGRFDFLAFRTLGRTFGARVRVPIAWAHAFLRVEAVHCIVCPCFEEHRSGFQHPV